MAGTIIYYNTKVNEINNNEQEKTSFKENNEIIGSQIEYEDEINEDIDNSEENIYLSNVWIPYKAEKDGEEISLNIIWGSSIQHYGGYLKFNQNEKTYSEFIGAYSDESIEALQGKYTVSGNKITFIPNKGEKSTAEYITDEEGRKIIKKEELDNVYVYFRDYINIEGVEYEELNTELLSDEMFCLTNVKWTQDGVYTLYGIIYKKDSSGYTGTLSLGNYKKITVSEDIEYIGEYISEELENKTTVKKAFENSAYPCIEGEGIEWPLSIAANSANLLDFEFENNRCIRITEYDLPT